jgi:perosamine synthetase
MSERRIVMFYPYVNERAVDLVSETLRSRWIGEGPRVRQFEDALCAKFDFPYAVALNSGTAALQLALTIACVGPGDEVITTAQTCTATNMAIMGQFAQPVFADVQYRTGNLDPADIEHRVTERTKAILCVHWAGYPCDMDEIQDIANRHGLYVIEDAAHALGATYRGRSIGMISDFTMFSFQAIKQLTTGDGGLLTVLNTSHYDEARRRRWFGIDRRKRRKRLDGYAFWNQREVGFKMHMNDIAASIGLGNLEDIDGVLARRAEIARTYRAALEGVPGVTLFEQRGDRQSGHWLFTLHVERRDDFCRMMRDRGVEVSVAHIRNDLHSIFGPQRDDLPTLDRYSRTHISIPLHNHLSDADVRYVIDCIKGGW